MRPRQDGAALRRPRFQFSLRLLFAVITLVALVLGLRIWQLRRQEEALAAVRRLGGAAVALDESAATGLLRPLFFPKIMKVNLQGTEATNDDLKLVARFSRLESLNLSKTKISAGGLAPLGNLRSVAFLSLADTDIGGDDLVHVGRLTGLMSLDLSGTAVSDAGLEHLGSLSALQVLSIHGSKVTGAGLERLCGLPALDSLSLDENQITPAAVGCLQKMPGVKRVFVHVPRGTGKRAWELLRPLRSVSASGIRRADARALWVTSAPRVDAMSDLFLVSSAPWDDTIAGVFERIRSRVALSPRQEALLLDALLKACKQEVWAPVGGWTIATSRPAADQEPPIRTADELIELVMKGGPGSLSRARSFIASGAARPAVPALLELLDGPQQKDGDYRIYHRAVYLLIRIAGADREVIAALARIFESGDEQRRVYAAQALDDRDELLDHVGPKINAEQAEALVPLLLRWSKDPSPNVRLYIAMALGSIVPAHPKHAEAALPVLLDMLGTKDSNESAVALWAWGRIAEVRHAEAAGAVLAAWRRVLRERKTPAARSLGQILGGIVRDNPEELKTIIPAILAMLEDEDRGVRAAAALVLDGVAAGVWEQKRELPGAVAPKRN